MTDDRSLERAARSFIEPGPTRAPEAAVEAALLRIQATPQERDWHVPRRIQTMSTPARVAAAAVIGVLAVGATMFVIRPVSPDVGTKPSAPTATSPAPSSGIPAPSESASNAALIPAGMYATDPVAVADIVASIDADGALTAGQRTDLIKNVIAIKGASTYSASIELRSGRFTQRQTVDGRVDVGSGGTYSFMGGNTLILREACCLDGFLVTPRPTGFSLKSLTASANEEDAFVVRFLFESRPFNRMP
jgi:hypothetical protein